MRYVLTLIRRLGLSVLLFGLAMSAGANSYLTDTVDMSYKCSVSLTPLTQGEYATAQVTVPSEVRDSLGRLDVFVDGQPQAGGSWAGNVYRQLFKVDTRNDTLGVSFVVYAPLSGREMCAGSTRAQVYRERVKRRRPKPTFSLFLEAPTMFRVGKLGGGDQTLCAGEVLGGTAPFQVAWFLDGQVVYRPTLKVVADKGSSSLDLRTISDLKTGSRKVRVDVTDANGVRLSQSRNIKIVDCDAAMHGPVKVRAGEKTTWTIELVGTAPFKQAQAVWVDGGTVSLGTQPGRYPVTRTLDSPGSYQLGLDFSDADGCWSGYNWTIVVDKAATRPPRNPGSRTCKSGFKQACKGAYCCRSGSYCWDRNAIRRGDCYRR